MLLERPLVSLSLSLSLSEEWFGTVGKWNVEICNIDISEDEGYDKDPLLVLVVHRPDVGMAHNISDMSLEEQPFKGNIKDPLLL